MKLNPLIFILIITFFSCKKDKNVFLGGAFASPEYIFHCDSSLTQPITGWVDSIADKDKAVQKILYNPINENEVIYIVKSKNYYSEMYLYNLQTKIAKSIDKSIYTMPSINKYGWLTYCKANFQVYKIKYNGDSLTQVSTYAGDYPRWDYTGKNIFYAQFGFGNSPQKVIKMSEFGAKLDSLPYDGLLGVFSKSNKVLGWKQTGNQLFIKDLDTGIETTIKAGDYNYPCVFDNSDQNIFWWNNNGIFKLNLMSLKQDTVKKICSLNNFLDTPTFNLYATNVSPNSNKLTFVQITNKAVHWPKLYHEYHALEMDLNNNRITEINLFQ